MAVHLHQFDLPADVTFGDQVAVDTETTGLDLNRDRLCVVQLSGGDGDAHLVHFPEPDYDAPNLCRLLADESTTKLFHFARFDVAVLWQTLGVVCRPVYCTKIASKLVRTYTDRHGLKDLCSELIGVELSKKQQSSDWAAATLSEAQQAYAASDVLHLHKLREKLDVMLEREGRDALAEACFAFLEVRAALDLEGWDGEDIFAH
jgi:ribonuclease D